MVRPYLSIHVYSWNVSIDIKYTSCAYAKKIQCLEGNPKIYLSQKGPFKDSEAIVCLWSHTGRPYCRVVSVR
jgi:hypothetical protein